MPNPIAQRLRSFIFVCHCRWGCSFWQGKPVHYP